MFELDPTLKPVFIVVVLTILWTFESIRPMFSFSIKRIRHDLNNIALGIINAVLAGLMFSSLVFTVTTWAMENGVGLLSYLNYPPAVELLIGLLIFDCWQYWWHRLNHRIEFFWRFHAVHHSDAAMDASSALRFHSVEILYSSAVRVLILPLIGLSIQQLMIYELILLPIILFQHSNIALPEWLDKRLRVVIVTPRIHWVHHSSVKQETDSNYASLLSVWDRIFGSFRLRDEPRDIVFGLGAKFDSSEWNSISGMLKQPFDSLLYKKDS